MPLALRPTRLSRNPDAKDEGGQEIGRLYEDRTATRPEIAWFWSITVMGPARDRVRTDGRAATLEAAKAHFEEAWERFKAANGCMFDRPRRACRVRARVDTRPYRGRPRPCKGPCGRASKPKGGL